MNLWGLHLIDLCVVSVYFFALFAFGKYLASECQWHINSWFRSVRFLTIADLLEDRFEGKALPSMFAAFTILFNFLARKNDQWRTHRFYLKMRTPMMTDAEMNEVYLNADLAGDKVCANIRFSLTAIGSSTN